MSKLKAYYTEINLSILIRLSQSNYLKTLLRENGFNFYLQYIPQNNFEKWLRRMYSLPIAIFYYIHKYKFTKDTCYDYDTPSRSINNLTSLVIQAIISAIL